MLKGLDRHFPSIILMGIILLIGAYYLFADSMNTYPAYVHAWTQSDRLALAMNFQENGFDFFHPATYNLLTKDGITQVDFPIHDYLVALISSAFNLDLISTFRWYNLLYSLLGMSFLFSLFLASTKSAVRSVFATVFIFTLPFYVYYQNGFLASAPSFANFLIALYFLHASWKHKSKRSYYQAVLFLTLAALARAPFIIFLFALLMQQLYLLFKLRIRPFYYLLAPFLGLLAFTAYWYYNQQLGKEYGSMFLTELLYFRSPTHFIETISVAMDRWGDQLLSPFHAILLIGIIIAGIKQLRKAGIGGYANYQILAYFCISSIGVLIFFFALGQQFAEHDYYYVDSFLPLLVIGLLLLIPLVRIRPQWYTPVATLCGIFFFYLFSFAAEKQELRYTPPFDDRIEYAYQVYNRVTDDLKEWGISKDDTLYVIEANSTNIPFTVWGNRGYTNLNSSASFLSRELDSNFQYAILIDSFFVSSTFNDYPEIIKRLEKVHGNGEISVYKKSNNGQASDFFDHLIQSGHIDFDGQNSIPKMALKQLPIEEISYSEGKCIKIGAGNEFSLTYRDTLREVKNDRPIEVLLRLDYFQEDNTDFQLVFSSKDYYVARYSINEFKTTSDWDKRLLRYRIPEGKLQRGDELLFYFWNPKQNQLYIDNIHLLIYQ